MRVKKPITNQIQAIPPERGQALATPTLRENSLNLGNQMATVRQQLRYTSSSERNVLNFLSRFRGVNIGSAETRKDWIERLTNMDFDLTKLKRTLGVKANDMGHDEVLNEALNQAKSSVKKSGVKAVKGEPASAEAALEALEALEVTGDGITQPIVAKKKSLAAGQSKIRGKLSLKKSGDPVPA